jgi:hypothetical protein
VHEHCPFKHVAVGAHEAPHAPQLALSLCSLRHAPPQALYPALQATPHALPLQVALPFEGVGQVAPHVAPQLLMSVLLTQVPLHACVPPGHTQVPAWHVVPPVHALPQLPQLLLSVCSSTHVLPHTV